MTGGENIWGRISGHGPTSYVRPICALRCLSRYHLIVNTDSTIMSKVRDTRRHFHADICKHCATFKTVQQNNNSFTNSSLQADVISSCTKYSILLTTIILDENFYAPCYYRIRDGNDMSVGKYVVFLNLL